MRPDDAPSSGLIRRSRDSLGPRGAKHARSRNLDRNWPGRLVHFSLSEEERNICQIRGRSRVCMLLLRITATCRRNYPEPRRHRRTSVKIGSAGWLDHKLQAQGAGKRRHKCSLLLLTRNWVEAIFRDDTSQDTESNSISDPPTFIAHISPTGFPFLYGYRTRTL